LEAKHLEEVLEQSAELADPGAKNILVEHLWSNMVDIDEKYQQMKFFFDNGSTSTHG
jgi:hypothetical protein